MKTAVIYSSVHHGNTAKLVNAVADSCEVTLVDAVKTKEFDLSSFDLIGFASGVYYSKYHKSIVAFAENNLPEGKQVFFMHTGGDPRENQNSAIKAVTDGKNCKCLGTYFCKGFDTFGPFKLVGGIAKGHPNETDIAGAVEFCKKLIEQ